MWELVTVLTIIGLCPLHTSEHLNDLRYAEALHWPGYSIWPPGTTFERQIVGGYHAHWYQQQVPTVVPRITYKIENTPVRSYVYVEKEVDEVQRQTAYVPVARIVEEDVTTTVILPFVVAGPDGKPIITCRPEIKTHKISRTVHDMKPVVREYRIKVKRMVPEERITNVQHSVPVVVYDQQLTMQWQYTLVPYQQIQTVPVFDPHHAPQLFWP
jgi:hypothetical protein